MKERKQRNKQIKESLERKKETNKETNKHFKERKKETIERKKNKLTLILICSFEGCRLVDPELQSMTPEDGSRKESLSVR